MWIKKVTIIVVFHFMKRRLKNKGTRGLAKLQKRWCFTGVHGVTVQGRMERELRRQDPPYVTA